MDRMDELRYQYLDDMSIRDEVDQDDLRIVIHLYPHLDLFTLATEENKQRFWTGYNLAQDQIKPSHWKILKILFMKNRHYYDYINKKTTYVVDRLLWDTDDNYAEHYKRKVYHETR